MKVDNSGERGTPDGYGQGGVKCTKNQINKEQDIGNPRTQSLVN